MTERLQTSEEINIHERGGLTPEIWQRLLSILPESSKEAAYAKAVITGDLNDVHFTHRQYLGRRHWQNISNLVKESPEAFNNPRLATQIGLYADIEKGMVTTFDDVLDIIERESKYYWIDRGKLRWGNNTGAWRYHYIEAVGSWGNPRDEYDTTDYAIYEDRVRDIEEGHYLAPHLIRASWLLREEDCKDPIHTSPEDLALLTRTLAVERHDELVERLTNKNWYKNPAGHIGNWQLGWRNISGLAERLELKHTVVKANAKVSPPELVALFQSKADLKDVELVAKVLSGIYEAHYGYRPFVVLTVRRLKGLFHRQERLFTCTTKEDLPGALRPISDYRFSIYEQISDHEILLEGSQDLREPLATEEKWPVEKLIPKGA